MSLQLYYKDPYQQSCESGILDIVPLNEDLIGLVLEQTCFFPRGGGAAGDTGKIDDFDVNEVFLDKESNTIIHPVSKQFENLFSKGQKVYCHINWERRFNIMRLHSASHIMEHFLFQLCPDIELTGTNVNDSRDHSTYQAQGRLADEVIAELNKKTNAFISSGYEILSYPDETDPSFRYWECHDIKIPCGGVHPKNTAEIRLVSIKRKGGGTRQDIRTSFA